MPFDKTLWQAVVLTGGLLPFALLFIEWIYWHGSSNALTRPIEFWGVFSHLFYASLGALMQARMQGVGQ